jgi:hypothetical protein
MLSYKYSHLRFSYGRLLKIKVCGFGRNYNCHTTVGCYTDSD